MLHLMDVMEGVVAKDLLIDSLKEPQDDQRKGHLEIIKFHLVVSQVQLQGEPLIGRHLVDLNLSHGLFDDSVILLQYILVEVGKLLCDFFLNHYIYIYSL